MNSVERMIEYTVLEPEAPAIVEARRPLPGWPHQVRTGRRCSLLPARTAKAQV